VNKQNATFHNTIIPYPIKDTIPEMSKKTPKTHLFDCDHCGGPSNKLCSGCNLASYCCRECQSADWKAGHKYKCEPDEEDRKPNPSAPMEEVTCGICFSSGLLVKCTAELNRSGAKDPTCLKNCTFQLCVPCTLRWEHERPFCPQCGFGTPSGSVSDAVKDFIIKDDYTSIQVIFDIYMTHPISRDDPRYNPFKSFVANHLAQKKITDLIRLADQAVVDRALAEVFELLTLSIKMDRKNGWAYMHMSVYYGLVNDKPKRVLYANLAYELNKCEVTQQNRDMAWPCAYN
jgi:hypothetical protein